MSGPIVPPLEVTEVDGSPDGRPITKIVVSNGDLTVSGRTATIDTSGSGMASFDVAGDTGSAQTISDGNTLTIKNAAGGAIKTVAQATDELTIDLTVSGVTAASYTSTDLTVDAQGRITAASDGGGGGATTLSGLTDVLIDATNFTDGLLIQPNSNGSAPTTGTLSSASNNIGIGGDVMKALTTGYDNVMIGHDAGKVVTSTAASVFIGSYAGMSAALGGVGDQSVLIGYEAGKDDAAGAYNTLVGYQAGKARTTGNSNTMVGHFAGGRMTEGVANTFFGISAGKGASSSATGGYNCAFGDSALRGVSTGIKNIAVGRDSGTSITTGDNNVVIGGGNVASGTDDDQLLIASGNGGVSFIVGDSAGSCYQGDNASTWSTTSDQRLKREIVDSETGLDAINAVQVRNFRYIEKAEPIMGTEIDEGDEHERIVGYDGENRYNLDPEPLRVGVIAQELIDVFPDAVKENTLGHLTVNTDSINWALLRAVQELSAKVEALEAA